MSIRLPALCRLTAALVGCVVTAAGAAAAERTNFVLVMADDQGWGDVGYYGHPHIKTPVLDEMARTALRLDRFYAAAPVCSPTRGSVMTGRHPNRFGCFSWGHTLRTQEITVAEVLQAAGYATGHFGKWHLGPVTAESPLSPGGSGFDAWVSSPNFYENDPLLSDRGKVIRTRGEGSQVTVEAALKFIGEAAGRKQPFLAVVWFGSPHVPHQALPGDLEPYKHLPPRVQHYLGEITAMDRAVGSLRDGLRELGVADDTLLWYTSDNGPHEPGSTGGLSGKKGNLGEGGIRVPTVIEWPARVKAPQATTLPAYTSDIYPTLLEIAGLEAPDSRPLDGVSLLPLIDGSMAARPKPMGFWVHPTGGIRVPAQQILAEMLKQQEAGKDIGSAAGQGPSKIDKKYSPSDLPGHAAWIEGDWKLHRIPAAGGSFTYTLYNLAEDAAEKRDLVAGEPERTERMKAGLEAWQQSVVRSLNGEDYKP